MNRLTKSLLSVSLLSLISACDAKKPESTDSSDPSVAMAAAVGFPVSASWHEEQIETNPGKPVRTASIDYVVSGANWMGKLHLEGKTYTLGQIGEKLLSRATQNNARTFDPKRVLLPVFRQFAHTPNHPANGIIPLTADSIPGLGVHCSFDAGMKFPVKLDTVINGEKTEITYSQFRRLDPLAAETAIENALRDVPLAVP